jgi:hypothetical protein
VITHSRLNVLPWKWTTTEFISNSNVNSIITYKCKLSKSWDPKDFGVSIAVVTASKMVTSD